MRTTSERAFTSLELVVVVGTLLLIILLTPLLFRPRRHYCGVACISNVKQIALAFRLWSNDHADRFPMQVLEAQGGSHASALAGNPVPTFMILSNELNSPKLLTCPQDVQRWRTNDFLFVSQQNVSFFVGIDASEISPTNILVGDRHILVNGVLTNGLIAITNPSTATWAAGIHSHGGNFAFADGSAFQVTTKDLQKALRASGFETNRFAVP